MKLAIALLSLAMLAAACSSGEPQTEASVTPEPRASPTSSPTPRPTPTRPSPTPRPTPTALDPQVEQDFVADTTASLFEANRETLSTELVKSSSLVEAQDDFRFDRAARTIVVAVTSVFNSDGREYRDQVAYDMATEFAPVFWGPEATSSVRPESTVLFAVAVDGLQYRCPGTSMVSLARRELSQERFIEQCAA